MVIKNKNTVLHASIIQIMRAFTTCCLIGSVQSVHSYTFPVFPINPNLSSIETGAGRFGEGREKQNKSPVGFGTYGHQGVDISATTKTKLYAVADSRILASVNTGGGGGIGTVLQPINGPDIVAVYWHQSKLTDKVRNKSGTVKAGEHIGWAGGTTAATLNQAGKKQLAVHLHFGVGVPNSSDALATTLYNRPTSSAGIYKLGLGGSGGSGGTTAKFGGKNYYWTNPAPYLSKDVLIRTTKQPDPLVKYIGNSIRSQYNALTGSNLPLGPGAKAGTLADQIPKLKIRNSGVPSSVATEKAQMGVVVLIEEGNADELLGRGEISSEEYAQYAPPRTIFTGSNDEVTIDVGDGDITQSELIAKIGTSRFNNSEWQKQLANVSMRGMLVDYLNAINAKNFIKKEMIHQKERIESLYAAWTAQSAKQEVAPELIKTLSATIKVDAIPDVSSIPVEELLERVQAGEDVSDLDMMRAVTVSSVTGQPKGCNTAFVTRLRNQVSPAEQKQIMALALRLGFHPNDFATALAVETGFFTSDKRKFYRTNTPGKSSAAGYIQLVPSGTSGIPFEKFNSMFPTGKPIITKYLGNNPSARAKSVRAGLYLHDLNAQDPRLEFAIYDGYFYSKVRNFSSYAPSSKTLVQLYTMIFGGAQYEGSAGYKSNRPYDIDNNGVLTAAEAVKNERFTAAYCYYWRDSEILNNIYGLTDQDLKLLQWEKAIAKQTSPTLENLGGNFMHIQGLLRKKGN